MLNKIPNRGDVVVYRKTKFGDRPGPRAKQIYPTAGGDDYTYYVDKYWVVAGVLENGVLLLKTRTGKRHVVNVKDPLLRPLSWLERWLRKHDLPTLAQIEALEQSRTEAQHAQAVSA